MRLLSKKKLFATLDKYIMTSTRFDLNHPMISNETYGKKSCIYIHCTSVGNKNSLIDTLEAEGFKINSGYAPNSQTIEVQVSYFKGWHWDE